MIHKRASGFTLVEVLVALGIAGGILTAVALIMVGAKKEGARNEARAFMAMESAFVSQLLAEDLRYAGVGVPVISNNNLESGGDFASVVLAANTTSFSVLGDRPRPDAQYNTFSLLYMREANSGGTDHHFYMYNENNGPCAPESGSTNCTIGNTSLFFPGIGAVCDDTSATWFNITGNPSGRACPWGMKRLRDGEVFQVVAGNGDWQNVDFQESLHDHDFIVPFTGSDDFGFGWDLGDFDADPLAQGQGFVTTLDRVVWRYDAANDRLLRQHCWGPSNPGNGNWDSVTNPGNVPGSTCLNANFEVMLENVTSVSFTYFDGTSSTPATVANIDRIEWEIGLTRTVQGHNVHHTFSGGVGIRNAF